jgi:hypothetical protein
MVKFDKDEMYRLLESINNGGMTRKSLLSALRKLLRLSGLS